MQNNQTKQIANGAMMIAIFAVLISISSYIPLIGLVTTVVSPLPLAWYAATYNRKSSIAVAIIAILISVLIGGGLLILPFALTFAAIGVAIGDALRLKGTKVYLFISTSIVVLFTSALQYLISLKLLEVDIIQDSFKLMRESYESSLKYAEEITGQSALPADQLNQLFDTLEKVIPAIITMSVLFLTFVLISINLPILKRFKIDVPKFAAFSEMKLPKIVLWLSLIVVSINLFIGPSTDSALGIITMNFYILLMCLLALQGVSLLFYFIDHNQLPKVVKGLTVLISIPLFSFITLIGIIDLGFNIRGYIDTKSKK